jgi:hypothetical protein
LEITPLLGWVIPMSGGWASVGRWQATSTHNSVPAKSQGLGLEAQKG